MKIRHTVIFTFYESTTEEQIEEVIARVNEMGEYLKRKVDVTNWIVAKHIPETFKERRAHLLQDGIFPSVEALKMHGNLEEHKRVVELASRVCDWMTIDTAVAD
jgi:Stress responsive A/B Barrel Domain